MGRILSIDRLILIRVKLERAKKHLSNLETELLNFGHRKQYVAAAYIDDKTGKPLVNTSVLRQLPVFPFDMLAAAGDVIHNLRCSLDHLAYQLVLVGTENAEPTRRVEFPIAKDFATYESEKPRKVEGMRPQAIKAIDDLKPYDGGNDALWSIHSLDNLDKHRVLFKFTTDCLFVADWMDTVPETQGQPYWLKANEPHFGGIHGTNVDHYSELEITEPDSQVQIPQRNPLLPTLHQLTDFVANLISDFRMYLE